MGATAVTSGSPEAQLQQVFVITVFAVDLAADIPLRWGIRVAFRRCLIDEPSIEHCRKASGATPRNGITSLFVGSL